MQREGAALTKGSALPGEPDRLWQLEALGQCLVYTGECGGRIQDELVRTCAVDPDGNEDDGARFRQREGDFPPARGVC